MSCEDRNGLPRSCGNGFPQSSSDGILLSSQCENVFPSLGNGGTGHRLYSTFSNPHVTLLASRFPRIKKNI